jgi:amino acid transporter
MNTRQEYIDKLMREQLKPDLIEKAPSGFTAKVMTRVNLEAKPVRVREKFRTVYIVPIITLTVTLLLTVMVLLLPASGYDSTVIPWMKIVRHINLPSFNLNLDSLFSFDVPGYLPYLIICLLFLSIFDRGLSGLFHRDK